MAWCVIGFLAFIVLVCLVWDFTERRKIQARWEIKQYDRRFNIDQYKRYEDRLK